MINHGDLIDFHNNYQYRIKGETDTQVKHKKHQ